MNFIKDNENCYTVICCGQSHTFNQDHHNFAKLVQALHEKNDDMFNKYIDVSCQIQKWAYGKFSFRGGNLYYKGNLIHNTITDRIVDMVDSGIDHMPIMRFLENLYKNPSFYIIEKTGLYDFLQHKQLPITNDGCFIGQKSVKQYHGENVRVNNGELKDGDLTDIHTGGKSGLRSYRNNVGDICRIDRSQVEVDRDQHCSNGLHVGSSEYVNWYSGSHKILVKVNPKDVVSIPNDHSCQKLRCCEYKVIEFYKNEISSSYYEEE